MGGVGGVRIRFVAEAKSGERVLVRFADPRPGCAVVVDAAVKGIGEGAAGDDALDVALLPLTVGAAMEQVGVEWEWLASGDAPPVLVKYRGVELGWRPGRAGSGRAVLRCDAEQTEGLLAALAEFAYYERELRLIEGEIAGGWGELAEDKGLAFEVRTGDLRRNEVVGGRMGRVLERRIRLARIEPHLNEPDARLGAVGQKLGEELRGKAGVEARLEAVDGQLEVFEYVYELSGQRMGEFRAAHQEHVLEWVIIVLLAAEALLMLWAKL
jgi:hypothetical protein